MNFPNGSKDEPHAKVMTWDGYTFLKPWDTAVFVKKSKGKRPSAPLFLLPDRRFPCPLFFALCQSATSDFEQLIGE